MTYHEAEENTGGFDKPDVLRTCVVVFNKSFSTESLVKAVISCGGGKCLWMTFNIS